MFTPYIHPLGDIWHIVSQIICYYTGKVVANSNMIFFKDKGYYPLLKPHHPSGGGDIPHTDPLPPENHRKSQKITVA